MNDQHRSAPLAADDTGPRTESDPGRPPVEPVSPAPLRAASPAQQPMRPTQPEEVAAVDLGSNSFHLIVARDLAGELRAVTRMREGVRLAAGLDDHRWLSDESQERALACLKRFGELLGHLPPEHVRAVGTNTLRAARNARHFLDRAEAVLGHPIDIVSGREEGRLTYLGVCRSIPPDAGRRLVVDLGGGSTEYILGEGSDVLRLESKHMGCVSFSLRFFPDGAMDRDAFKRAELAARLELEDLVESWQPDSETRCLGTSGTVHAIQSIVEAEGWSDGGITPSALGKLRDKLISAGHVDRLSLRELKGDRKPVLPGGLAILRATLQSLEISRLHAAPAGLREGLLHELHGRFHHEDVRDHTIRNLMNRYHVDQAQTRRVERTAVDLFDQLHESWKLEPERRHILARTARVHEIGLAISHASYHRHGEYLLTHGELAGFTREDQHVLALLVRAHRRKLPEGLFEELPHIKPKTMLRLCLLLRLAVLLQRSRGARVLPPVCARARKSNLELIFRPGWLDEHPLARADLEFEKKVFASAGYTLVIVDGPAAS